MIFSDELLFLHVPKTGGTSVSRYLTDDLRGPVRVTAPGWARKPIAEAKVFPRPDRLKVIDGVVHETLDQAVPILASEALSLESFAVILVGVRDPFELEWSYFQQIRKPAVQERHGKDHPAVRIARAGDFARFCEEAPIMGRLPSGIERYYTVDGREPPNLRIVRFERLAEDVMRIAGPFCKGQADFKHMNHSVRAAPPEPDVRIRRAVKAKYDYLFRFYPDTSGP